MMCAITPKFESWHEGERYARTGGNRRHAERTLYHCPNCGRFHFGITKPKPTPKARQRRLREIEA